MNRTLRALALLLVIAMIAFFALALCTPRSASATGSDEPCVPSDAYSETIEHPAVTHTEVVVVVDEPAYTETVPGTPDLWWNWSPNHQQGPFDGPPAFPVDPRGTWQGPHENGGPSQDTYGTFQQGNGNGSWFHREQGTPETTIEHPAVTHEETIVVTDEEAYTETVEHPAVTCPEEPPVEEPPVEEPPVEEPVTSTEIRCLGGSLVTEVFVDGVRTSSSTENGHPRCAPEPGAPPVLEEGM